jgi:uncharacterized metal-binding protein YceD (DUF177 family)
MKAKTPVTTPELSRPLLVDKISAGGVEETLVASPDERKLVAERFGLLDLPKLEAQLSVAPARAAMFRVTGRMQADVVQQCVVTLEPLPAHIEQDIDVLFGDPQFLEPGDAPAPLDAEAEETEHIIDGIIDLGELVAQHLGVSLDPYPRKPGLAFVEAEYGDDEGGRPFAKLAALTKTGKKGKKK